MIVRSYPGLVAGSHGEVKNLVGEELGKDWLLTLQHKKCPSYSVEILQPGVKPTKTILTLFSSRLDTNIQEWWYSKHPRSRDSSNIAPQVA